MTFAWSVMLLWGIMDNAVMRLITDTKTFLIFAGLAGLIYALSQPFKPRERR